MLLKKILAGSFVVASLFVVATFISVRPISLAHKGVRAPLQILDRRGTPLTVSYQGAWNENDVMALHEIPEFLQQVFVQSEDKRFFSHNGVDWQARGHALWQNIRYRRTVRGASTMTEQVVRMVHPRSRHLWSKYIEGFEAATLERQYSKAEILEFYLNQIPFAANRRGVMQAARYYYDRDLSTLTEREMLALAVLARAPSAYDLYRYPEKTKVAIDRLAQQVGRGDVLARVLAQDIRTVPPQRPVEARHFARFVRTQPLPGSNHVITTLDAHIQSVAQDILDQRVESLAAKKVTNGAAVVMDHASGEILAWVVAGAGQDDIDSSDIDAVSVPRQPGSAMKPFLYARALDKGLSAATFLDDSPLSEAVGTGLHRFRNYSRNYYGPISVREALGNSLNIPALLTIRHVGIADYLTILHRLGFRSLDRGSDVYDEGLALGNGEVTLLELVQAYGVLAHRGVAQPVRYIMDDPAPRQQQRIYSEEATSLIGNILSDPWARRLEFGPGSALNLSVQTAVKTGTSTDYRDAWVVGYNDQYVVGIWMGNLDRTAMDGVTGSTGPALALRGIFTKLNEVRDTKRLYLSPSLVRREVCIRPGAECLKRSEWMRPSDENILNAAVVRVPEMIRPTEGLQLAYDPRVPGAHQKFRFEIGGLAPGDRVSWTLNGDFLAESEGGTFLWPLHKGPQKLKARVMRAAGEVTEMAEVSFLVK